MINYENLRLSDYYTLKLKNTNKTKDNYIDLNKNEIVFNHFVKNEVKDKITIKLKRNEIQLFKDIFKDYPDERLFQNIQLNGYKKG